MARIDWPLSTLRLYQPSGPHRHELAFSPAQPGLVPGPVGPMVVAEHMVWIDSCSYGTCITHNYKYQ
jgi:hypothetical protein